MNFAIPTKYVIQFQRGLPLADFLARYGTEAQCVNEIERQRWPGGFECPRCAGRDPYRVAHGRRVVLQCRRCHHQTSLMARKPRDLPQFHWVNTVLANLKTTINGAYKHFRFGKYASAYLAAFAYRFNRRFHLASMMTSLMFDLGLSKPMRARQTRCGCAL
jgi:ribosomal protein L37AE/L43A